MNPNTKLNTTLDQQVITFGCRLNFYESEIIKKNLALSSLDNVVVLNSCAVTNEAERTVRQAIRRIKKEDSTKKIIVTGCAAQTNPDSFSKMEEVDKVIGNEEKLHPEYYNFSSESQRVVVNDIMSIKETANHMITNFSGKARAFIEVQNGCNHRCTFCIIPFGRGNSRSVPIGMIVNQIRILLSQGYNEIVFTGVDLTSYGEDLPGNPSFSQMIKRVLALVPELKRLRLSSIDVGEIDDQLFDLMAYHERLMPHFHISLQSGDNMILKRMKRRHTREQVIDFCNKLRSIRPEVAFGADIIAGFPTETEEMFNNSKDLITEASIQYLHIFPYSERKNTPAARMPQVAHAVRKERAKILTSAGQAEQEAFFKRNVGQKVNLLVEKNNIAHTENFIPVKLSDDFESGQLLQGKLLDYDAKHMSATITD